ncbi:MAG: hypothetical protein IPO67_02515 [Deltaproteobacteria bacterium]|nr:hypothetical protein [Deltaproteobacteria bacterium]
MTRLSLWGLLPFALLACGDKDGTTPDDSTSTTDDSTTDDSTTDDSTTDDSTTDDTSTGALPTCEDTFAACGGDPTGSWTFAEACYVSTRPTECEQARWTIKTTQTGGYEFAADKTYSAAFKVITELTYVAEKTCLTEGQTCEELAEPLKLDTCVDKGDVCECKGGGAMDSATTGTWATSGTTLTLTGDSAPKAAEHDYCVSPGEAMEIVMKPPPPGIEGEPRQIYKVKSGA